MTFTLTQAEKEKKSYNAKSFVYEEKMMTNNFYMINMLLKK